MSPHPLPMHEGNVEVSNPVFMLTMFLTQVVLYQLLVNFFVCAV